MPTFPHASVLHLVILWRQFQKQRASIHLLPSLKLRPFHMR